MSNRKSVFGRGRRSRRSRRSGRVRADDLEEKECVRKAASLPLIELGIRCTLSQLIETGVMHADPHGGNLLRLRETGELAYLDFGLVSEIPPTVRDGLVAAVTCSCLTRLRSRRRFVWRAAARADGRHREPVPVRGAHHRAEGGGRGDAELPRRRARSGTRGERDGGGGRLRRAKSAVPDVRFDQLLGALLALVPKYRFLLPPYFLNNARALVPWRAGAPRIPTLTSSPSSTPSR